MVCCTFFYRDEVDRVVGIDGTSSKAEFTFDNGLIKKFLCRPPDEHERQRHRAAKAPFFAWARENYPEEVAKGFNFDYESGYSLYRVARAWYESTHNKDLDAGG